MALFMELFFKHPILC